MSEAERLFWEHMADLYLQKIVDEHRRRMAAFKAVFGPFKDLEDPS